MTAAAELRRCSSMADAAGDPQEGTAPHVEQWFIAEHLGPWGPHALPEADVAPRAVAAIMAWAGQNRGRPQVARLPGRASWEVPPLRWFRVDSRPGRESIRTGLCHTEDELIVAVTGPGEPYDEPLNLVCVHGRHDACCALRGRPLAAALDAAGHGRTWECSHLGGCRFSPSLVLLPHGFLFGGVPPEEAAALVERYDQGLLDPRWLRGRVTFPPAVQAAQHHARAATGDLRRDALVPVATTRPDEGATRVVFADPDCTVTVTERQVVVDRPLTCTGPAPTRMRVFDLVAVDRPSSRR